MSDIADIRRPGGIPAFTAWWALSLVLAIAIAVLLFLLLNREPDTVIRDVPSSQDSAPTPEMLAEVQRLAAKADELDADRIAILRQVAAYECPPGTEPADRQRLEAIKRQARDLLAAAGAAPAAPAAAPDAEPAGDAAGPEADTARQAVPASAASRLTLGQLSQLLERSVVFLLPIRGEQVTATGSGFFVAPDLIATNRHVVEQADPDSIVVISDALGDVVRARVVAASPKGPPGAPDFALLRTERAVAPAVIPLSSQHGKLMEVVVGGYPGLALGTDAGFRRLLQGDRTAAPDMHQNTGEIRSTQDLGATTSIIHTADVLGGYSGGPLIDRCGRAVGINTFIQVDQEQTSKFNSALAAPELLEFLNLNGAGLTSDERICRP
jgi:S1-C subfamily serine protease